MKIAVECKSLLLQKSLEIFLLKYVSSKKLSDIIVRDQVCLDDKRCFYIASNLDADLQKPFSKSQLILALEKKYESLQQSEERSTSKVGNSEALNFEMLEKRIDYLTKEYQQNIINTVKAFYEK